MNKFVLLATAVGFVLPSVSYGMDRVEPYNNFKRKYQPVHNQQYREDPPSKKARLQPLSTERLSTPQSHRQYLQDAISSATKSILITSHGVDREAFKDGNLYHLLAGLRNRGVKVYIYNIDNKDIDTNTARFFQDHAISYAMTYTHAKLLAVDDKKVAIGSYNWLSKATNWENATFCISGEECKKLVDLLWQDLKYYRNIQFGNEKQIQQYEDNSRNQEFENWSLDHSTKLYYLHSLNQHRSFISGAFQNAKNYLIFCAPFIHEKSGYKEDFEWNLLSKTISRGVHICFACRAEDPNLASFRNYLGDLLQSPLMHLIPVSEIHQKTVIVDDVTIAEGSFNLLCATRDEKSNYHNHEVTLMLNGTQAKGFIQDFRNSNVGQAIVKVISNQNPQQDKPKELIKVVKPKFPSWQENPQSLSKPNNFEIFSGRNFGKEGFCVRFDKKDYIVDDGKKTIYFHTEKDAEEAALNFMSKNIKPSSWQNNSKNSQWQKNLPSSSKQNNFEIFSGYKFGKEGFCVRFDKKDYIVDDEGKTIYFPTEKEAQQAAYEFK